MTKRDVLRTLGVLVVSALAAAQAHGGVAPPGGGDPGVPPEGEGGGTEFWENFDSYAEGSDMHGQGGWKGWDNNPGAGALVTSAFSYSSPHSVDINGGSDLVHEFSGFTTGMWVLTAWTYVPSGTPQSYLIALNTYNDGGPYNWSMQVFFDAGAGVVVSEFDGGTLPIITDEWVEFRVEIDLDTDTQTAFYGGMQLYSKSWTQGVSGGGVLNIAAVNLFANGATSIYYDNVSLCPASGCLVPVELQSFSVD